MKKVFDCRHILILELDVDLLNQEERYDTNAVAGLLKSFLRELPNPLFNESELGVADGQTGLEPLKKALYQTNVFNYILLRTLIGHLVRISSQSKVNKMTPHNLSIIFSPTLQISTGTFSLFLQEFEALFCRDVAVSELPNPESSHSSSHDLNEAN